jgi:hypothetical protein
MFQHIAKCAYINYSMQSPVGYYPEELRYHRTVIVTAAVHRSFDNNLNSYESQPPSLTYRHWAGVSPYTLPFGFAGTCVLDKQSLNNLLLRPRRAWQGISHRLRLAFVAEFLNPLSPGHLSLLDLPTCVGLRYGKICVLASLTAVIMRLFWETETYQIISCYQETFNHSSIKHDDGFTYHHYLTALTHHSGLDFSNSVTTL